MTKLLQIKQSPSFAKDLKKLHKNQQADVYHAIADLRENPTLGELKIGDLSGVRVYKFRMVKQQTLIAYHYLDDELVLHLLMFGPHENFYDQLKRQLH